MLYIDNPEVEACRHPPCRCRIPHGSEYCSKSCEVALRFDRCSCGHEDCQSNDKSASLRPDQATRSIAASPAGSRGKFADCPNHASGPKRFAQVLRHLHDKLERNQRTDARDNTGSTGRGDELAEAAELSNLAQLLDQLQQPDLAAKLDMEARRLIANQLNELDGFAQ